MQTRPVRWADLLSSQHKVEYRYVINGVEYTPEYVQGTPSIEKPLMREPVIGRCCTGSFNITVRKMPNVTIPKAAPVSVSCRLTSPDSLIFTDWIPQGVYWIVKRTGQGDLITLTCRDNMIFAGQTYADKTGFIEWPVAMVDVFSEIVTLMDVQVDARTVINQGEAYMCDYPNPDELMSEILAKIAAAHGGNFIMTEAGKLRLVPFPSTGDPVFSVGTAYTDYEPYSTGNKVVSRVTFNDSAGNEFSVGDDSGIEVFGFCDSATHLLANAVAYNYYVFNDTFYSIRGSFAAGTALILEASAAINNGTLSFATTGLIGKQFLPYCLSGAYFDPCVELGDTFSISYKGNTLNLIANSIIIDCTVGYSVQLENGVREDDEEEIPYFTPADLQAKRTIKTNQTYFGNRINRSEGFVSEYMVDDIAVARMIANSNLFTMQRYTNGAWENVLYFDPVAGQYKFSGEVTIDTRGFKASAVQVDNQSLVFAANAVGQVLAAATLTVNVIAYTGDTSVIPTVSSVVSSAPPGEMGISIGSPDNHNRVPITITVQQGVTFGSAQSINGELSIYVTSPISEVIKVNWCKLNTGLTGAQGASGASGRNGSNGINQTVIQLYQRAATQPSIPGACEYTFSTNALTGSVGSWLRSIPDGSNPCWVTSAAVSSSDNVISIPDTAWTGVIKLVENGANGTSITILGSYDSVSELPATGSNGDAYIVGNDLYVWSSTANDWVDVGAIRGPAGQNGKNGVSNFVFIRYSQYSDGHSMTTTPNVDTKYIGFYIAESSTESPIYTQYTWSKYAGDNGINQAMVYIYKRADTRPNPPNADLVYTFATGALSPSGDLEGWSKSIPADEDGKPCWMTMQQAIGSTSTVTLGRLDWPQPTILVRDGEDGVGTETYYMPLADAENVGKSGDLLIDSDTNKLYRHDGVKWEFVQDQQVTDALGILTSVKSTVEVLDSTVQSMVSAAYVTQDAFTSFASTVEQSATDIEQRFTTVTDRIDSTQRQMETMIRSSSEGIEIGKSDSNISCLLTNNTLYFRQKVNNQQIVIVAYLSNQKLYVKNMQFIESLAIGTESDSHVWKWEKTSLGLGLKYTAQ